MMKLNSKGFTLIEILVALAITSVVLTAIYAAYQSQQKAYIIQQDIAMMQQNLRAAMYLMTQEIRMAGYDPTGTAGAGITATGSGTFSFTKDLDGDGDVTGSSENITYSLYTSDGIQKLGRKNPTVNMPVALYIDDLDFVFLDANNAVAGVTSDIRSVQITLVARTERSELGYVNNFIYQNLQGTTVFGPAGDSYHRSALSTQIKCRNLGL
jgi:type IV pilus assembly protein PilW